MLSNDLTLEETPTQRSADGTAPLAASYARKSTPADDAVEDQHLANAQRAAHDGYRIPQASGFRFGDDNTKGHLTSRGGLDELLDVIYSGEAPFRRLYVRDRDRLSRVKDPRYLFWFEYECKRYGIQVCYSSKQGDHVDYEIVDGGRAIGEFVTDAVENVRTSEEVRMLSKRINTGLRRKIVRGDWPGSWTPYATERWLVDKATGEFLQKLMPGVSVRQAGCSYRLRWNADETPIVKEIFDEIEAGRSLRSIAVRLNDRGIPSPGARRAGGAPTDRWLAKDVWAIARSSLYKGDLVWGGKAHDGAPIHFEKADLLDRGGIFYPGYLPGAPVSVEQWASVQDVLNGNAATQHRRRASKPHYLLTGLILCAACGGVLTGHTSARETAGERVRYYRHQPTRRRGAPRCRHTQRYVPANLLEQAALDTVTRSLADGAIVRMVQEELARQLADAGAAAREREAKKTRALIDRLTRSLDNATGLASDANTDVERQSYERQAKRFAAELEAKQRHLVQLESAGKQLRDLESRLPDVQSRVARLQPIFESGGAEERKQVVASIIHALSVDFDTGNVELRVRALSDVA